MTIVRSRPAVAAGLGLAVLLSTAVLAAPSRAATVAGPGVGTTADDGAVVVGSSWNQDDNTLTIQIQSPAVGRTLPVKLLLPATWSATATRTWPTMTMLAGAGGDNEATWSNNTELRSWSKSWDVIVVCPDGGLNGTFTNYFNNGQGGTPQWETFHTKEVNQILERGFRAGTKRAIAGISSGGYGSMIYAARNPGMYKFAASYSGMVAIRLPAVRWFVYNAAGDADPTARFGVPYINERNWELHDPLYMADKLRGTGLFLSSGQTGADGPVSQAPWDSNQAIEAASGSVNEAFNLKLKALGIPVTTDFYLRGHHAWAEWNVEMKKSWPLMMKAIGATNTN